MDIKNTLKTSVAVGALLALAAPMATAEAAGIKQGNSKIDLAVGGQIVRSIWYADDGEHSQLFQTDGFTAGSRIRFIPSGQLTESIKVGGLFEFDISQSNDPGTSTLSANGETAGGAVAIGSRHSDISFQHKTMGKLSIGRGNAASNGRSEVSLAGTGNVVLTNGSIGGGLRIFNDTTKAYTALTLGGQGSSFDGQSRTSRVRYDLPTFAGLGLAASLQDDGAVDFGAGYSAKFGSVAVKLGAQFSPEKGASNAQSWSTSGGALHDSGLNVSWVYGQQANVGGASDNTNNASDRDQNTWKLGVGYKAKLTALGGTNFGVEYWESEDISAQGRKLDTLSLIAVQELSSIGSEMSLSYHRSGFSDNTANNYNDIDIVYFQTKLNF